MDLHLVYSWNDAKRRWRVTCHEHPSALGLGVSPSKARRAILKSLSGALGPNQDAITVHEAFELPEELRQRQLRYNKRRNAISALTTSAIALEVELALSLRRMRLPIQQIAQLLGIAPQRTDAILQLQAGRPTPLAESSASS